MRKKITIVSTVSLISIAGIAYSAGYPTFDAACVAKSAEIISNTTSQLSKLEQLTQASNSLKKAIGDLGLNNIINVDDIMNQVLAYAKLDPSLTWNTASIQKTSPNWSDIDTARQSAQTIFYGKAGTGVTERTETYSRRHDARRLAAVNGYALSQYVRGDIKETPNQIGSLANKARNSTDLRTDVAVNTETLLQLSKQLVGMESLLAAMVEIEATTALAVDNKVTE